MRFVDYISRAMRDADERDYDHAMMEACIAIDAISKRIFPGEKRVGIRFKNTIRQYYWLIEPTSGMGLSMEETRFKYISLRNINDPDVADIIYEVFRCTFAHGDELPPGFKFSQNVGTDRTHWAGSLVDGYIVFPDRLVWSLLFVCVLSKVSAKERLGGSHHFTLGNESWLVDDLWGKEDEFREVAEKYNTIRMIMQQP